MFQHGGRSRIYAARHNVYPRILFLINLLWSSAQSSDREDLPWLQIDANTSLIMAKYAPDQGFNHGPNTSLQKSFTSNCSLHPKFDFVLDKLMRHGPNDLNLGKRSKGRCNYCATPTHNNEQAVHEMRENTCVARIRLPSTASQTKNATLSCTQTPRPRHPCSKGNNQAMNFQHEMCIMLMLLNTFIPKINTFKTIRHRNLVLQCRNWLQH